MSETYSLHKDIIQIGLKIDINTPSKELLMKLDDAITSTVIEHYEIGKGGKTWQPIMKKKAEKS